MVWVANFLLILAYVLLGCKRPRMGWLCSMLGNLVYAAIILRTLHRLDFAFMAVVFVLLSGWNLWKLRKP